MASKKVLIVGHGKAVITEALKAIEESEGSLFIIVDSPGGSTDNPQPPSLDVDSTTFTPKYFPTSKSKYHK